MLNGDASTKRKKVFKENKWIDTVPLIINETFKTSDKDIVDKTKYKKKNWYSKYPDIFI